MNRKVFIVRCFEDIIVDDFYKYFSKFGEVLDVFIFKFFRVFVFVIFMDVEIV